MPLLEASIVAFMEGFLILGAGLGVLGSRLQLKTMILIAILYSLITYGVRQFYIIVKIPFGTHTFVIIGALIIMTILLAKQSVMDSFIAALIGLVHIFLGESLFLFPLMQFFNIDPLVTTGKPGGYVLAGIITYIPLIVTFFIGYMLKKTLIDFSSFKISDRM